MFPGQSSSFYLKVFTTYVRPILEFCMSIWSPYQVSLIKEIEKVQRAYTKYIPGKINNQSLFDLSYVERLNFLKLESLLFRRICHDLVLIWKFVHGDIFQNSFTNFFTIENSTRNLRGHSLKIKTTHIKTANFHNFWTNRTILLWNSLKNDTVTASNAKHFKKLLLQNDIKTISDHINKRFPNALE